MSTKELINLFPVANKPDKGRPISFRTTKNEKKGWFLKGDVKHYEIDGLQVIRHFISFGSYSSRGFIFLLGPTLNWT